MSEKKKHPADKSKDTGENSVTNSLDKTTSEVSDDSSASYLFDRVSFRKDNFVQNWATRSDNVYDTILW